MVTPRVEGWGLGVALLDGARWFGHTGDNAGYRCALFATVDGDTAVAVMANGDAAVPVLTSLTRAACEAVGAATPPLP
jgi:hypothetical protein